MKKPFILICLAISSLSACVTFSQMEEGLNNLIGKHEQVAFNTLGYPDGKQEFGHDTIYYWSTNRTETLILPQTTTTYGTVGTTPIYGSTTYNQFVPVNYNCTIKLIADQDGTIKNWEYEGNIGGCKNYITRLKKTTINVDNLPKTIKALNANAPIMIDKATRLDSAQYEKQQITYNYTLVNTDISNTDVDKFKRNIRSSLLETACAPHKGLLEEGFNVHYFYNDKNQNHVATISITNKDCGL